MNIGRLVMAIRRRQLDNVFRKEQGQIEPSPTAYWYLQPFLDAEDDPRLALRLAVLLALHRQHSPAYTPYLWLFKLTPGEQRQVLESPDGIQLALALEHYIKRFGPFDYRVLYKDMQQWPQARVHWALAQKGRKV